MIGRKENPLGVGTRPRVLTSATSFFFQERITGQPSWESSWHPQLPLLQEAPCPLKYLPNITPLSCGSVCFKKLPVLPRSDLSWAFTSFVHSDIQQVFTECLLRARHCCSCCLFTDSWPCWVFLAVWASPWGAGFSPLRPLLLQSPGSRVCGLQVLQHTACRPQAQ